MISTARLESLADASDAIARNLLRGAAMAASIALFWILATGLTHDLIGVLTAAIGPFAATLAICAASVFTGWGSYHNARLITALGTIAYCVVTLHIERRRSRRVRHGG